MSMATAAPGERIERLARYLAERGHLRTAAWHDALRAVPRHLFVPARAWVAHDMAGGSSHGIDRDGDPGAWWDAVYSDTAIVTQIDDGTGDPAKGEGMWTSSISTPGIVLAFFEQLDVQDHHRVLEIGTGSGWTAALLAHRVGAENVTTVEIDPGLAAWAAANLGEARPRLIVGDGVAGHPDAAPYDRVHVACGVTDVPGAWIDQTRPGGVIVLPWMPGFAGGYQTRLTVVGDGMAVGRFTGTASYMMLRSQRFPDLRLDELDDAGQETTTRLDPRGLVRDTRTTAALAARLIDVVAGGGETSDGGFVLRLRERHGPSWATAVFAPGRADYDVRQYGERGLWDEAVAAYEWWVRAGSPGLDRFGMTVTPDHQTVWLDDPNNPVTP